YLHNCYNSFALTHVFSYHHLFYLPHKNGLTIICIGITIRYLKSKITIIFYVYRAYSKFFAALFVLSLVALVFPNAPIHLKFPQSIGCKSFRKQYRHRTARMDTPISESRMFATDVLL